jgi:hypothetical protein
MASRSEQAAGERRLPIGEDRACFPLFRDAPAIENNDPAGDRPHDAHLVGDENDGETELAVDVTQQRENGRRRFGIERGGRFVRQEDRGIGRERAGDADALFLPARELGGLGGIGVGFVLKAGQPQQDRTRSRRSLCVLPAILNGSAVYNRNVLMS